jgi:hypothetical protein
MLVCYRALRGHALRVETRFAEDRTSTFLDWARLERNLTLCTALGARSVEHLPVLHALILALVAAVLAALWSGKTALSVESLLTFRESEWRTAVAAL